MKRFVSMLLTILLLTSLSPALAQVYVDQERPADWEERDLLRLTVFRTGEGDCMLLQAGDEYMMIDGGPYKYREKLKNALEERGISHFRYIFNTHPHDDHVEGLRMLLYYGFTTDEFISVFPLNYSFTYQKKAAEQIKKSGVAYRQLENEETIAFGEATLTVYTWQAGKTINAKSAMAKLQYKGSSALLCADIIGETQHYFLENLPADVLKADVVKAPHHGLTPFVTEFLTAVDPEFIWVTNFSSATNKTNAQAKYRSLPIKHSGDGTVYLETDGEDWYVYQTLKQF